MIFFERAEREQSCRIGKNNLDLDERKSTCWPLICFCARRKKSDMELWLHQPWAHRDTRHAFEGNAISNCTGTKTAQTYAASIFILIEQRNPSHEMKDLYNFWEVLSLENNGDFEEGKYSRGFDRVKERYNISVASDNLNFSLPGRKSRREHCSPSLLFWIFDLIETCGVQSNKANLVVLSEREETEHGRSPSKFEPILVRHRERDRTSLCVCVILKTWP